MRGKFAAIGCLSFALSACHEVSTVLLVSKENLSLETKKEGSVSLPEGRYDIEFTISDDGTDELHIFESETKHHVIHKAELQLPPYKDLANVKERMEISADKIGQPFDLVVTRDTDPGIQFIGFSLMKPGTQTILATAHFKSDLVEDGKDSAQEKSFVREYQNFRRSQRGVFIPINGALSGDLNGLVNWTAKLFIAPWIYARYANVEWELNMDEANVEENVKAKWARLFEKSPVVDYFAFTHSWEDEEMARHMPIEKKKLHQLRYVYTEACHSGSASVFIKKYNAALTTGHSDTSASPFFAFSLIRNWVYGKNVEGSVRAGWSGGKGFIHVLDAVGISTAIAKTSGWDDTENMINDSELMLAWTRETPPTLLRIGGGALPSRKLKDDRGIFENRISELNRTLPSQVGEVSEAVSR
jgi:hypothetical protein